MSKTKNSMERVTLFKQETPKGLTYRIPALLYLPSESTFLAFAEERSTPSDEDAKFLVMRRGKRDGISVQWGPQEPLTTATLPDYRTMSPCPVYEKRTGTIFLFFNCVKKNVSECHQLVTGRNAARLCHVLSTDGGRTWSQITDLTDQVIGSDLKNWATFAVGPGHGLQLSNGRLLITAYTYYIHKRSCGHPLQCWTKPHSVMFYSDDCGQNWVHGQLLHLKTTECQVAELRRQEGGPILYCNSRTADRYRASAFSMDGGQQFENSFLCKHLVEPPKGCQGSIVSITPTGTEPSSTSHKDSKSWLIFSHPTNKHKRSDLGIYLNTSPLEKGSWKAPWVIYNGPSGYSDLAVCEENPLLFGCLFECGVNNYSEEIAFQLFTKI